VARAWLSPTSEGSCAQGIPSGGAEPEGAAPQRPELGRWLLYPPIATAVSVVVLGVFAGAPVSPLTWAVFIAEELVQP
jgi:hypothetical protein